MIRGVNDIHYQAGVKWNDPPVISDSCFQIRVNRWNEKIFNPEGELIEYTVVYATVRKIFGERRYRKGTSGRFAEFWDSHDRNLMLSNMNLIREEDNIIEYI